MKMASKRLIGAGLSTGFMLTAMASTAGATDGYGGGKSYGGYGSMGRASSYINPDTGAATANRDVDPGSNCYNPDQRDRQAFSPANMGTNNVHNDACFLDRSGNKIDGPATFESNGVGFISACPDPDGAGPKTTTLSDTNGDGRNDRCFQSGYQETGKAGDEEFHARLNNTGMAGTQYVTWCSDKDMNGCGNEWNRSSIRIDWSADGTATYSADDRGYRS